MSDALVISGLGLTSAYGIGRRAFWHGLVRGERGLGPLTDAGRPEAVGGQVALPPGDGRRRTRLLTAALDEALGNGPPPARTLLVLVGQAPRVPTAYDEDQDDDEDALELTASWPPPGRTAVEFDEVVFLSQACASVLFGLGYARDWVLGGLGDAAVVAGAFTLNRYEYLGMSVVGALSPGGARPFDSGRDGTSLGEGSAAVLVEREPEVRARGGRPLARVAGLDCRVGGNSRTASDAAVVSRCMSTALHEAGLDRVDYVHAHATGTPQGDLAETTAIDGLGACLGWHGVPVGSHKGAIGHLMQVSAGAGIAAGIGTLGTGIAPGTPGLTTPVETTDAIRIIRAAEPVPRPGAVLINSFGFAGNNAAAVLTAAHQ
ncbi:beta-ketoacyl synthase N-terminal-like domain-containing protein [Actinomadura scrupuli]|uniref:beta-ketoacyl synthase N-terminal-like domain-containing protein n=1 Tax=Actinomadura scrupuli TaxID=559629 RepID=UPI003D97BC3C